jgi:hypothetical protein
MTPNLSDIDAGVFFASDLRPGDTHYSPSFGPRVVAAVGPVPGQPDRLHIDYEDGGWAKLDDDLEVQALQGGMSR